VAEECEHIVGLIHESGFQAAMAVSGGGSGAVHALLSRPGASRFVLEAQIPYSPQALAAYLGDVPAQACSEATARAMAAKALERAVELQGSRPLGVACTAALQTNRIRRGADRAFFCFQTPEKTFFQRLEIAAGSRADQEGFLGDTLLGSLAGFLRELKA
jgi:nicotinamide mononucleotide (NMN) deamidase PncC